jgi:hypothetical protein
MLFAHDTVEALQAAAALVNAEEPPRTLETVAELDAFFTRFGYTGRHDRTQAELEEVRALAPRLRELLLADRDDAAGLVNEMLAEVGAVPRLVRHEGEDWHVHAAALVVGAHVET